MRIPLPLRSRQGGYTLYLVMVVLAVAAILFSITIRDIRSVRIFTKKEVQKRQAKLLAESGIIRTEYFLNGGDGHSMEWETPGFEETFDDFGTIRLVVERFGLFSRVKSTGKRRVTEYIVDGLFGRAVPQVLAPTLTLTGHVGGLILHKGSSIEGDIVLHHGYVYAKKRGNPLPEYTRRLTLRESPPLPFDTLLLPAVFETCTRRRTSCLRDGPSVGGQLVLHGGNDSLLRAKALVVNGDCRIRTPRCIGAVIVVSGTCTIEQGAMVRSTACYADRIIVESGTTDASLFFSEKILSINGGSHNSQFLARDSIVARNVAAFGRMNVIAGCREAIKKDSIETAGGGVFIEENSAVRGTVISFSAPQVNRAVMSPSITFGRHSTLKGIVVTDGDCYFYENEVAGSVWARSIVARDADGSYTNYLISSTIKPLVGELPFPLMGGLPLRIVFERTIDPSPETGQTKSGK